MTVLDHPPTLREAVAIVVAAAVLIASGYAAGVWHSANFASRSALDQLEIRVLKLGTGPL